MGMSQSPEGHALTSLALRADISRTEPGAWRPPLVGDDYDGNDTGGDDNDDDDRDGLITGAGQTYSVGAGVMSIITSEYVGYQICLWQVRLSVSSRSSIIIPVRHHRSVSSRSSIINLFCAVVIIVRCHHD